MKQALFKVLSNREVTSGVWEMVLEGDTSEITRPGQFVNIEIPGHFLRRPISVCDFTDSTLVLLYKVVGEGTRYMASLENGAGLDLLTGLGNGFDTSLTREKALLAGGGIGVAPLYRLARQLRAETKDVTVILCFNSAPELFYRKQFEELGVKVVVATVDGTMGVKGFVTDAIRESRVEFDCFYACGPMPMLRAMSQQVEGPGQVSLEARMGCGFGACMGCTCKTMLGAKRICKEGPVFFKEEVQW